MSPIFLLMTALMAGVADEERLCRQVDAEEWAVVERVSRDGVKGGRACSYVAAPPKHVYAVLIDYESYPAWMDKMGATTVQWSSDVTAEVGYRLELRWGEFNYTMLRTHEPPEHIRWVMTEGDFAQVDGYYRLQPAADGQHTLLFLEQYMDAGRYVPGFIERYIQQRASRQLLQDIRDETMRREAAAPGLASDIAEEEP